MVWLSVTRFSTVLQRDMLMDSDAIDFLAISYWTGPWPHCEGDIWPRCKSPVTHLKTNMENSKHVILKVVFFLGRGVHLVDLRDVFVCFRGVKGGFFFKTPFFWGISSGLSPSCILGEVTHMMFQGKTTGDVGRISGLWNLVNLWIAVISTDVWRYMWRDTSFRRLWHSEYVANYSATAKNA